jgi:hypothetical protein
MTAQTPAPAATSTRRKLTYTAAGALVLVIGIGIGSANTTPTAPAGPTAADYAAADQFRQMLASPAPGQLPVSIPLAPADPAAPPAPAAPLTRIPSGGPYAVGTDVAAGTYHTTGPDGSLDDCYWERDSDMTGNSIIANGLGKGPATITIASSDAVFTTQGCGVWVRTGK